MGLLDLIKRDAQFITTNTNDFAESSVTFIAPSGEEAEVSALHTKHHLGYDLQTAQEINTFKAHIDVCEQELIDQYYPVRNAEHEVYLENHKVRARDANGRTWTYVIKEWFPNDKVGVIVCILGRHV